MALYFDLGVALADLKSGAPTRQWGQWLTDLFGRVDSLNTSISAVPGVNNQTIAELNALGLGAADENYLARVTDGFNHLVRWTGTVWAWGPGDAGAGYFGDFAITPDTNQWALCDGSATTYLSGIGTVTLAATALTTPVLSGSYRKSGAAYSSTVTAGSASGETADVGVSGGAGNMDIFGFNAGAGATSVVASISTFAHRHGAGTLVPDPAHITTLPYLRR